VTSSSSRRSASAFRIDELLGLSRRDVIVTSFPPPPPGRSAAVLPVEGHRRRSPSSMVDGGALRCRCSADVARWTETSSRDLLRTPRVSLSATSQRHDAIADVDHSDEQRCAGIVL